MINFSNQVPSVYSNASRDFQYLGWLINVVLNSVKHNIDDIYGLPNTSGDTKLAELLAATLGFKIKRNYDKKQLVALSAVLPIVLRYKGTLKAIRIAAEALVMAAGSLGDISVSAEGAEVTVVLPKDLVDTALFLDLLDYILPAGMTCHVVRKMQSDPDIDPIYVHFADKVHYEVYDDLAWTADGMSTGLSGLFDVAQNTSEFTANFINDTDSYELNAGLLDNTVVPILSSKEVVPDNFVALWSTETDGEHKALYADGNILLKAKKSVQEF